MGFYLDNNKSYTPQILNSSGQSHVVAASYVLNNYSGTSSVNDFIVIPTGLYQKTSELIITDWNGTANLVGITITGNAGVTINGGLAVIFSGSHSNINLLSTGTDAWNAI